MDVAVFARFARHDFGVLVEPVQALAVGGFEIEVDEQAPARQARLDRLEQRVDPFSGQRGDGAWRAVLAWLLIHERI